MECAGVNFGFRYQNTVKQINDAGFEEIKEDYLDGTVLCGKKQEKKVRACPEMACEDVVCKENESISGDYDCHGCLTECPKCRPCCGGCTKKVKCGISEIFKAPKKDKNGCYLGCGGCKSTCKEPICAELICEEGKVLKESVDDLTGCKKCPTCECEELDCSSAPKTCPKPKILIKDVDKLGCRKCNRCIEPDIEPCKKCPNPLKKCPEGEVLETPTDPKNCKRCPICIKIPCPELICPEPK